MKVARRYSGNNLRGLNFHFPKPDVPEVLKQGIEMMKQKFSLHCNIYLIRDLRKVILPRKFRIESSNMYECMSAANKKDFIYYRFQFRLCLLRSIVGFIGLLNWSKTTLTGQVNWTIHLQPRILTLTKTGNFSNTDFLIYIVLWTYS